MIRRRRVVWRSGLVPAGRGQNPAKGHVTQTGFNHHRSHQVGYPFQSKVFPFCEGLSLSTTLNAIARFEI